jgi:hypothetical protein
MLARSSAKNRQQNFLSGSNVEQKLCRAQAIKLADAVAPAYAFLSAFTSSFARDAKADDGTVRFSRRARMPLWKGI